jgi:hypothetical protein
MWSTLLLQEVAVVGKEMVDQAAVLEVCLQAFLV